MASTRCCSYSAAVFQLSAILKMEAELDTGQPGLHEMQEPADLSLDTGLEQLFSILLKYPRPKSSVTAVYQLRGHS